MAPRPNAFRRSLSAILLFGVSFGFVEAAVVVYLREVYEPLAERFHPDRRPGDIFPLITLEQLESSGSHLRLLKTEFVREAATLVMLAAVGLAVGWNFNSFFGGFVASFGVWDICYYVFLYVLIGWPASLWEWDLLFLIPVPWVAPVLAPLLVASSMVAAGTLVVFRESAGRPVRIGWGHWSTIVLGGLIIVVAFCWDFRNAMAGQIPERFPWTIFLVGELTGLTAFALALRTRAQAA
jgi:hypothetical protein